jgi:hypothetical protein
MTPIEWLTAVGIVFTITLGIHSAVNAIVNAHRTREQKWDDEFRNTINSQVNELRSEVKAANATYDKMTERVWEEHKIIIQVRPAERQAAHSKGDRVKLQERIMFATERVIVALTFVWLIAFWSCVRSLPAEQPAIEAPITARRAPDAVMVTPNAGPLSPYVGSIRLDSKTYHVRGCTKYDIKYAKGYETKEEAEADGRQPCTHCIGRPQIARSR